MKKNKNKNNKTQRGGAPFRLSDKVNQTMEEALAVFIPASTKKVISHGENGVVLSCTASAARLQSLFVDLETPEKGAVLVVKIMPLAASKEAPEKQVVNLNLSTKMGFDSEYEPKRVSLYVQYEDDFEQEAQMQREIYERSLADLHYAVCPMLAFSAVLKPDDPMIRGWVALPNNQCGGHLCCHIGVIVMEMLTAPKTLNEVLKEKYGDNFRNMEYIEEHPEEGAEGPFKACSRLAFDLNSLGFAHNDLHTSNFLTSKARWFMVDFGFTKKLTQKQRARFNLLAERGETANAVESIEFKKNKDMPYIAFELGARPRLSPLLRLLSLKYAPQVDGTFALNAHLDADIAQARQDQLDQAERHRATLESDARRRKESDERKAAAPAQGWATAMVASLWQRAKRTFSRRH